MRPLPQVRVGGQWYLRQRSAYGETVVGTLILGFIMVGTAITFLSRWKIELGSGREVRGGPLLFVSLFLVLPMPICVTAGFMEGEKAQKQAVPVDVYIK